MTNTDYINKRVLDRDVIITEEREFISDNMNFIMKRMGDYSMNLLEHSMSVAQVSMDIALELGFDEEAAFIVYLKGLVHDIGKLFIDKNILYKKGPLTDEEYEVMKQHSVLGFNFLNEIGLGDLSGPALNHHKREDGGGYGGSSDIFSYDEKIVAVADVFSAMIQDRVYQSSVSLHQAGVEINRVAGTQLNTVVVNAFNRVLLTKYMVEGEVKYA